VRHASLRQAAAKTQPHYTVGHTQTDAIEAVEVWITTRLGNRAAGFFNTCLHDIFFTSELDQIVSKRHFPSIQAYPAPQNHHPDI
jgi:hypothetical protein